MLSQRVPYTGNYLDKIFLKIKFLKLSGSRCRGFAERVVARGAWPRRVSLGHLGNYNINCVGKCGKCWPLSGAERGCPICVASGIQSMHSTLSQLKFTLDFSDNIQLESLCFLIKGCFLMSLINYSFNILVVISLDSYFFPAIHVSDS